MEHRCQSTSLNVCWALHLTLAGPTPWTFSTSVYALAGPVYLRLAGQCHLLHLTCPGHLHWFLIALTVNTSLVNLKTIFLFSTSLTKENSMVVMKCILQNWETNLFTNTRNPFLGNHRAMILQSLKLKNDKF